MYYAEICYFDDDNYYRIINPFVFQNVEDGIAFFYNIGWVYNEFDDMFLSSSGPRGYLVKEDRHGKSEFHHRPTDCEIESKTVYIKSHMG